MVAWWVGKPVVEQWMIHRVGVVIARLLDMPHVSGERVNRRAGLIWTYGRRFRGKYRDVAPAITSALTTLGLERRKNSARVGPTKFYLLGTSE